jgi:hypothetical protein
MKRIVTYNLKLFIIGVYSFVPSILGLVVLIKESLSLPAGAPYLYIYIIGLVVYLLALSASLLIVFNKTELLGIYLMLFIQIPQVLAFIMGNTWFQFQNGLSLGFVYSVLNSSGWSGPNLQFLFNIGTSFRLLFNDSNTDFSIAVNILSIIIIKILVSELLVRKKKAH